MPLVRAIQQAQLTVRLALTVQRASAAGVLRGPTAHTAVLGLADYVLLASFNLRKALQHAGSALQARSASTQVWPPPTSASRASPVTMKGAPRPPSHAQPARTAHELSPPTSQTRPCSRPATLVCAARAPTASGVFTRPTWTLRIHRQPRSASLARTVAKAARRRTARASAGRDTTALRTPLR
jgi:hypothetical protein